MIYSQIGTDSPQPTSSPLRCVARLERADYKQRESPTDSSLDTDAAARNHRQMDLGRNRVLTAFDGQPTL